MFEHLPFLDFSFERANHVALALHELLLGRNRCLKTFHVDCSHCVFVWEEVRHRRPMRVIIRAGFQISSSSSSALQKDVQHVVHIRQRLVFRAQPTIERILRRKKFDVHATVGVIVTRPCRHVPASWPERFAQPPAAQPDMHRACSPQGRSAGRPRAFPSPAR